MQKVSIDEPDEFENKPSFSDDDDEDCADDSDLMVDVNARKPGQQFGLGACIIVDGLPVVGPEKAEKLRSVVQKQLIPYGTIKNFRFPQGEDQQTLGYAFVEFETEDQAQQAIQNHNNYKFDKQHVLTVDSLAKYDEFVKEREDDATELKERPYREVGNLRYWQEDEEGTDQYLLLSSGGEVLSVYNNDRLQPTLLEERESWTESGARWSPQGTYLMTMHSKGIALWGWSGGDRFEQVCIFVSPNRNRRKFKEILGVRETVGRTVCASQRRRSHFLSRRTISADLSKPRTRRTAFARSRRRLGCCNCYENSEFFLQRERTPSKICQDLQVVARWQIFGILG